MRQAIAAKSPIRRCPVSSARQKRPILALTAPFAAMLAGVLCLNAAVPSTAQTPAQVSLAGQFLIAAPSMGDPRFERTVILMAGHDPNGAFGFVINRPVGERAVSDLLEMLGGEKDATVTAKVPIFYGGPVQPELAFVIHSSDYRRAQTLPIDGRVAVTSSREVLRDIGSDKGPKNSLVTFGYAGWRPGQIEGELRARAWVTAPADPRLIFEENREKLWDAAFALRTQDL